MKDKILKWYKQNLWTSDQVADAVNKGKITEEDFFEITGEDFSTKSALIK